MCVRVDECVAVCQLVGPDGYVKLFFDYKYKYECAGLENAKETYFKCMLVITICIQTGVIPKHSL